MEAEAIESNGARSRGPVVRRLYYAAAEEPWERCKSRVTKLHMGWASSVLRRFEQESKKGWMLGDHLISCYNL